MRKIEFRHRYVMVGVATSDLSLMPAGRISDLDGEWECAVGPNIGEDGLSTIALECRVRVGLPADFSDSMDAYSGLEDFAGAWGEKAGAWHRFAVEQLQMIDSLAAKFANALEWGLPQRAPRRRVRTVRESLLCLELRKDPTDAWLVIPSGAGEPGLHAEPVRIDEWLGRSGYDIVAARHAAEGSWVWDRNFPELPALVEELPIGVELFVESKSLRDAKARFVMQAVALETSVKEAVAARVPDAGWLVENLPAPPVAKLVFTYLPELKLLPGKAALRATHPGLPRALSDGIELRNKLVHGAKQWRGHSVSDAIRSTGSEFRKAVEVVLLRLAEARGSKWAGDAADSIRIR